jgi:hypothetical protein
VFAESLPRDTRAKDVGLLSRWADALVIAGRSEESLAVYERAEGLARQAKQDDVAFELGYKAALVQERLQRPADAAIRLRALSMAAPKHPQAAQAHLLAAWNAKGTADEEANSPRALATWPAADSAAGRTSRLAACRFWRQMAGGRSTTIQPFRENQPCYVEANARLAELAKGSRKAAPCKRALAASLLQSDDLSSAGLERLALIASRSSPIRRTGSITPHALLAISWATKPPQRKRIIERAPECA